MVIGVNIVRQLVMKNFILIEVNIMMLKDLYTLIGLILENTSELYNCVVDIQVILSQVLLLILITIF